MVLGESLAQAAQKVCQRGPTPTANSSCHPPRLLKPRNDAEAQAEEKGFDEAMTKQSSMVQSRIYLF